MKKTATLLLLALSLGAAAAHATSIGAEVYGGLSIPIVQDDSDQGSQFGVRLPVHVVPLLCVEPYFASSQLGDKTLTIGNVSYTRDGGKLTGYGVNARIGGAGAGLSFFPYVGIGSYTLKKAGLSDETDVGYNFGLGMQLTPMPKFGITLRGELNAIPIHEASRKYGNVTLGASYDFLSLP